MLSPPATSNAPPASPSAGRVYAALAVAVGSASFASILIRWSQPYAPSLVIAAYRLSIAALLLWPILLLRRRQHPARWRAAELGMTVISGTLLALHFGTWISSLAHTSVASSAVLVATAPLFVALLSPITIGERVPPRLFGGLALGLLGMLVIASSDVCAPGWPPQCVSPAAVLDSEALLGDLLALAGAVAMAGYLLIGRSLRHRVPLLPYITLTYTVAAIGLIGAASAFQLPLTGYPVQALGLFALLAIFPQLIAHSTYNWAVRHAAAAPVALTLLGEPVGAILLAALLLNERPEALELGGVTLILVGIWFGARSGTRSTSSAWRSHAGAGTPPSTSRRENGMQIRCQRCSSTVNLRKEEIAFALEELKKSGGRHYDVRCSRCRHSNRVSLDQLQRAAPRPAAGEGTTEESG